MTPTSTPVADVAGLGRHAGPALAAVEAGFLRNGFGFKSSFLIDWR